MDASVNHLLDQVKNKKSYLAEEHSPASTLGILELSVPEAATEEEEDSDE